MSNRRGGAQQTCSRWRRLSVLLAALALSACSEKRDRPPLADDGCYDDSCDDGPRPQGGGLAGAVMSSDGEAEPTDQPAANTGGAQNEPAASGGLTLRGQIAVATSADLVSVVDLPDGRVEVMAIEADGRRVETEFRASEDEEFSLEVSSLPIQVAVRQLDGELDLMATVQWAKRSPTQLLIVERAVLEQVAANLTSNATFLNEVRGHAFLEFIDAGNLPQSGVSVTASDAVVAYDIGIFYSDAEQQTATRGSALLLNAPAGNYPGDEQEVSYRFDGETTRVDVPIAEDSVTIRTIQLP